MDRMDLGAMVIISTRHLIINTVPSMEVSYVLIINLIDFSYYCFSFPWQFNHSIFIAYTRCPQKSGTADFQYLASKKCHIFLHD